MMKSILAFIFMGFSLGVLTMSIWYAHDRSVESHFCVFRENRTYSIDVIKISDIKDLETGQEGFAPVDPDFIRTTEKVVSCPKGSK